MLVTLVSGGRAASEVAGALQRLERRLNGGAPPDAGGASELERADGSGRDDLIEFVALPLESLSDTTALAESSIVIAICEGDRTQASALQSLVAEANSFGAAPVLMLGASVHHGATDIPTLPVRISLLSPDAGSVRTLYVSILREIAARTEGHSHRRTPARRLVARRMLGLARDAQGRYMPSSSRRRPSRRDARALAPAASHALGPFHMGGVR